MTENKAETIAVTREDGTRVQCPVISKSSEFEWEYRIKGTIQIEPREGWRLLRLIVPKDPDSQDGPWFTVYPIVGWARRDSRRIERTWIAFELDGNERTTTVGRRGDWEDDGVWPVYMCMGSGWAVVVGYDPHEPGGTWARCADRVLAPGVPLPDLTGFTEDPYWQPEGEDGVDLLIEMVRTKVER